MPLKILISSLKMVDFSFKFVRQPFENIILSRNWWFQTWQIPWKLDFCTKSESLARKIFFARFSMCLEQNFWNYFRKFCTIFGHDHTKCPCCITSVQSSAGHKPFGGWTNNKNFIKIRAIILTRAKFLFFFEVKNLEIFFDWLFWNQPHFFVA